MSSELLYAVADRVAWLTINREEKRNSISPRVIELFNKHLDAAEADESVRVVCITGSGEKAFCSGADMGGGGESSVSIPSQAYADLLKRLSGFPKPTMARINGHCLAGGTGIHARLRYRGGRRYVQVRDSGGQRGPVAHDDRGTDLP